VVPKKKRSAEAELLSVGGCTPLSVRCTWKRRTSSAVAVAGERPRNLAKASTWRI
jgi:hypothetical protein